MPRYTLPAAVSPPATDNAPSTSNSADDTPRFRMVGNKRIEILTAATASGASSLRPVASDLPQTATSDPLQARYQHNSFNRSSFKRYTWTNASVSDKASLDTARASFDAPDGESASTMMSRYNALSTQQQRLAGSTANAAASPG